MIRLENVSKRYRMGDVQVTALDNVSLEIDKGEFVVVLGPSGSGKTTLLNIIGALDVPTEGDVHINGGNMSLNKKANRFKFRRETVSFIFQTFNLFPSLTALENVQFVLDMANAPNSRESATRSASQCWAGRAGEPFPARAFGRRAAAGRDCAGAGNRQPGAAGRRTHRRTGLPHRHSDSWICCKSRPQPAKRCWS